MLIIDFSRFCLIDKKLYKESMTILFPEVSFILLLMMFLAIRLSVQAEPLLEIFVFSKSLLHKLTASVNSWLFHTVGGVSGA